MRDACEQVSEAWNTISVAAKLERYMLDVLKTLRRYWQWREYEAKRSANL